MFLTTQFSEKQQIVKNTSKRTKLHSTVQTLYQTRQQQTHMTDASKNHLQLTRSRSARKDGFGRQFRTTGPCDTEHPHHVVGIDV